MSEPDPMGVQQCTAHSKQTGQRCRQAVVPGAVVCHYHGGAAPHVKEAAMDRLRALQFPAIDAIYELIDQTQFPSVRYASSKDVLDRTLGRATEIIEVNQHLEVTVTERLLRGRSRNGHTEPV